MKKKLKYAYWIPTNKEIDKMLKSYVIEIDYVCTKYEIDIPVFILDSGNDEIEKLNDAAIREISRNYPNLSFYYLSLKKQETIINKIIDRAKLIPEFSQCFVINEINYGVTMNKIYLIATALGYDIIHRRDSDTFLQENCPYPPEVEVKYIGKPFET